MTGDSRIQPSIVERLREGVNGEFENYALRQEAADDIESLATRLVEATGLINDGSDTLIKIINAEAEIAALRAKVDELTVLGLFLVNRLDEFDPGDFDAERDFHGHVAPALARFRGALALNSQDGGSPNG